MVTEKDLIEPVEITISHKDLSKEFIIGHLPAFDADLVYDKIVSNDGVIPEDVKLKLLSVVLIKTDRGLVNLDKKVIIDEYVRPWPIFRKLVNKCVEVNFDFLDIGATSRT